MTDPLQEFNSEADAHTLSVFEQYAVSEPGIYDDVPAPIYHADKFCPQPSLSSSVAKQLCLGTPRKAFMAHPRLNPKAVEEEDGKFDIGTAAHALLLEGESGVVIVDAKDWRTNAAKDARDNARKQGKIPLLAKAWVDVQRMVERAVEQIEAQTDDGKFMFLGAGKPEQVVIWEEDGVWCRARLDWLRFTVGTYPGKIESTSIDDYKTTGGTADPEAWSRIMFSLGFDIQAAWYLRGLKAITGEDATFRFAVQETDEPYDLSVIGLGPDAMMLAEKKVLYALEKWRECLTSGKWEGYPRRTCWASLPAWEETRWLQKETNGKVFE